MKNSWIENPNSINMLYYFLYVYNFLFLQKALNLDFLWYFKVLSLGRFWQFWAEFAPLAMADSMPKDHLKS
jgi:hypothetical protein